MSLKPKTVRRLFLLAVVLALVLTAAFSLFFVRRWQLNRQFAAFRRDGLTALAAGHYRKSLADLGRYIHRGGRDDAEVLLAFARAREALEEPDFSHLRKAIQAYQEYLAVRPDDRDHRLKVARLGNQAGDWITARDEAERLRPSRIAECSEMHIDALREEATALTAAGMDGERTESVLSRLLDLAPLDLQANLMRIEVWARSNRRADAVRHANALGAAHPTDPVAQFIAAAATLVDPVFAEGQDARNIARVRIARAVGLDPSSGAVTDRVALPSAEFTSRVVDLFDRIASFDLSLAVLRRWAAEREGPVVGPVETGLQRTLARRLWQQGEHESCIAMVSGQPLERIDSEVLAFAAMSLQRAPAAAGAVQVGSITDLLEARTEDFRAAAWARVLPLTDPAGPSDPRAEVDVIRAAIQISNRIEPVFLAMLGERYLALARDEEALAAWNDAAASPVCASWPYPMMKQAEVLLAAGHAEKAGDAANRALLIAHDNASINALWFETRAAMLQKGVAMKEPPGEVLAALERALAQLESGPQSGPVRALVERLFVPRVVLVTRIEGTGVGAQLLRRLLDAPEPLSSQTLRQLAAVSAAEGLGLEKECLARTAATLGSSPAVAFSRAIQHAQYAEYEEGLELLQAAAAEGGAEARLNLARYMELISHPEAPRAWRELGDGLASDVVIQRACLWSRSIGGEREFVERTIARYQTLSGLASVADDPAVVTARARVVIAGSPSAKDLDAAIGSLGRIVTTNPALIEPRVLLARALVMSDPKRGIRPDEARAAAVLTEAVAIEPAMPELSLDLAAVLLRTGNSARAIDILSRVGQDVSVAASIRQSAAAMLLSTRGGPSGMPLRILEVVANQAASAGREPWPTLLSDLASAQDLAQRPNDAAETYARLVAHPRVTPAQLLAAAGFAQRVRQGELSRRALDRLDELEPSQAAKALNRARLAELRGDREVARQYFEEAVAAGPSSTESWRLYLTALLARGEHAAAVEVGTRAAGVLPNEPTLRALLEQARIAMVPADGHVDLGPLIAALAADPSQAAAAEVLRAAEAALIRGDLDKPEGIIALASKFPASTPLKVFLARRMITLDPGQAVQLVQSARADAPTDPRVASAAYEIHVALGRWADALAAAAAWREHAQGPEPDLAIAEARHQMHDYRGALAAIKGLIDGALADPEAGMSLEVLRMQTRLLIASGRPDEARDLLTPKLSEAARVRREVWLACAAEDMPTLESAKEWIDVVRTAARAEDIEEQLNIAAAWSVLAGRFPDHASEMLVNARVALRSLADGAGASSAAVWEALGVVTERLGDKAGAQAAYERSLSLDARRVVSLNNLAAMLAPTDPLAAVPLARRAVAAKADDITLGTLGSVLLKVAEVDHKAGRGLGALKEAAETFRRQARLRPGHTQAWARAAQASFDVEDYAASVEAWERVLAVPGLPALHEAAVKNNLADALVRRVGLDGGQASARDIDRARTLVVQAISVQDQAAFHDTLGWVELAAGRRQEAIASFRKAVDGGVSASAHIGLAMALASGTDEERREASVLAASVEASGLDPYLARKLQSLLTLVQVEKAEPGR